MTKEQLDSLTAEMIRSRLFICVAVDDKGHSQELFCGDPYKLIDVAFNTLLSMIDELETKEEQIAFAMVVLPVPFAPSTSASRPSKLTVMFLMLRKFSSVRLSIFMLLFLLIRDTITVKCYFSAP